MASLGALQTLAGATAGLNVSSLAGKLCLVLILIPQPVLGLWGDFFCSLLSVKVQKVHLKGC